MSWDRKAHHTRGYSAGMHLQRSWASVNPPSMRLWKAWSSANKMEAIHVLGYFSLHFTTNRVSKTLGIRPGRWWFKYHHPYRRNERQRLIEVHIGGINFARSNLNLRLAFLYYHTMHFIPRTRVVFMSFRLLAVQDLPHSLTGLDCWRFLFWLLILTFMFSQSNERD